MDFTFRRAAAAAILIAATFAGSAHAQTDGLLQLDDDLHTFLESKRTLGRLPNAHLIHKPLSAYEARNYLKRLASVSDTLATNSFPFPFPAPKYILPTPIGPFYGNGRDFWTVDGEDYAIQINPLLYVSVGQASRWLEFRRRAYLSDIEGRTGVRTTWRNTRGLRASGHIGPYIFFEARVEETQELPSLTRRQPRTAPRRGAVRPFADSTGYDYQIGIGVLGFRTDHFEVRFGRERNHWGYGEGSLLLSDYGPAYDQLQIRTTFWRLQYVNLFAGFTDVEPFRFERPDVVYPLKYGAFHRLSLNVTDRINLNVFEGVIFGPDSTSGRDSEFDLAYLNPVIFYRPIESDRGSPDNVLIGFGGSWIVVDGLQLYGEVLLDEFVLREMFTSSWRNKTGYLAGVHVVPTATLSLRAEYARLRPFLYTHRSPTMAYMNHLDIMGHPAGPNAVDVAFYLDWHPGSAWQASLNAAYTVKGRGTEMQNVGSDLRLSYDTRYADWVPMLAGVRQGILLVEASASYEMLPNLFFDIGLHVENIDDAEAGATGYFEPLAAIRWGLPLESERY